ncbi:MULTISPECIES: hypothetical protein [Comamonas]|uniref:hypothetical protein n=1 Tax=Comamonas TaxID=283 RepID=UPI00237E7AEC|nr:hypothetical protein [Comamonas aquatica]MDE1555365.1 hypothetical protein [Comamonas aquatica]
MTSSTHKPEQKQQPSTPAHEMSHRFSATRHQPIFCEGISQIAVGYPVSRLIFASQPPQRSADGKEITHFVATEVVLPTNGLAELAKQIIQSLIESKDQLGAIGNDWNKNLSELITHLENPETSGN